MLLKMILQVGICYMYYPLICDCLESLLHLFFFNFNYWCILRIFKNSSPIKFFQHPLFSSFFLYTYLIHVLTGLIWTEYFNCISWPAMTPFPNWLVGHRTISELLLIKWQMTVNFQDFLLFLWCWTFLL